MVHRDTCGEGFALEGLGKVNKVFLDVPRPWEAIVHAEKVMAKGGRICCFSPCIEQVQRNCVTLEKLGFVQITTIESLVREFNKVDQNEKLDFCFMNKEEKNGEHD